MSGGRASAGMVINMRDEPTATVKTVMMLKHPPGFLEPAIQSRLLFRGLAKLDGRTNFLAVTPSRVTASLDDRADLLDGQALPARL